jgi:hypothetical protein
MMADLGGSSMILIAGPNSMQQLSLWGGTERLPTRTSFVLAQSRGMFLDRFL